MSHKETRSPLLEKLKNQQSDAEKEFLESQRQCKFLREQAYRQGKVLCSICDYTGTFAAMNKENKHTYSFRCMRCNAASMMGMGERYPTLHNEIYAQYEVLK